MAQIQADALDDTKETTKDDVSVDTALCVCGKKLSVMLASQCYDGDGVECNRCEKEIPNASTMYHCAADRKNILHTFGYDLCVSCLKKTLSEINMDSVLFEIWFIINKLNKSIYYKMKSEYETISIKSLMSKSSYHVFKMVNSIDWNNDHEQDSTSGDENIELFLSKYDEFKDDYLSLGNQQKMDEMKDKVEEMEMEMRQLREEQEKSRPQEQRRTMSGSMYASSRNSGGGGNKKTTHFLRTLKKRIRRDNYDLSRGSSLSAMQSSNKNIGFSLGGAKDINSFRLNIKNHEIPNDDSITFEGIFGEYYFDTNIENQRNNENNELREETVDDDTKNDNNVKDVVNTKNNNNNELGEEKVDDKTQLPLFYPSYSYSKSIVPKCLRKDNKNNNNNNNTNTNDEQLQEEEFEYEHYLTIGLNSNIKEKDFQRKKLNLVIVLDISGSMGSKFNGTGGDNCDDNESKIKIARECTLLLLTHLNFDDRFGLILFDNNSQIEIDLKPMCQIKYKQFEKILKIESHGGTNMECGFNEAIRMFNKNDNNNNNNSYENRMIFLTDACPNDGATNPNELMKLVTDAANKNTNDNSQIYTTFVGIGVDFNSKLIHEISSVRGCNYFSVDSKKEFEKKLHLEFDYFVSPMVFNLKLTLFCEGGDGCIDKVFGDMNQNINVENGEIMCINTLFPSPPSEDDDSNDIKGGIVLIKLKNKNILQNKQYFIQTQFEDKFGKKFNTTDSIQFNNVNNNKNNSSSSSSYYANLGVRKGLLLVRYVLLMKEWINCNNQQRSEIYPKKLKQFREYFIKEMEIVKDDNLKREIDIVDKLINW